MGFAPELLDLEGPLEEMLSGLTVIGRAANLWAEEDDRPFKSGVTSICLIAGAIELVDVNALVDDPSCVKRVASV